MPSYDVFVATSVEHFLLVVFRLCPRNTITFYDIHVCYLNSLQIRSFKYYTLLAQFFLLMTIGPPSVRVIHH